MVDLNEIYSFTEFQRNAKEHIEHLKSTGKPRVLTINGKAELVVQDAKAYQKMLDVIDRLQAIEGVRRGLEAMEQNSGRSASEFFGEMQEKYKLQK
jgi:PHD/YefM family antitoxin component YafN of YafNO toxin-antitoxin module